jgi:hypothetical protein
MSNHVKNNNIVNIVAGLGQLEQIVNDLNARMFADLVFVVVKEKLIAAVHAQKVVDFLHCARFSDNLLQKAAIAIDGERLAYAVSYPPVALIHFTSFR